MKKLLYLLVFLLVIFSFCAYFVYNKMLTEFQVKKVYIEDKKAVYLKNFVRGLNYNRLAISVSDSREFNPERDYIYDWDETIFYKVSNDTLHVLSSELAPNPISDGAVGVIVVQETYSNSEYYTLIHSYREKGYNKLPE
ncbi:hypothetical protein [Parapedobacter sp. DT-150]|uniref:hypothetical protein n=1 Tax=Parapedobacter sp. DT-150 TaxID=3396162 RepID=UPI003F1AD697